MISFKRYLSEAKGGHMRHVEEMVLDDGVNGARNAINTLRSLRDMLAGNTKSPINVTVKWDGSPAIFAGYDPGDGKFFVARKGIFNKSPKIFKTPAEIDVEDVPEDLKNKMKLALAEFPKLGMKGVVQGDFLYAKEDLKVVDIDGEPHVTFHPNTIVYAVPKNSDLGKAILRSKVGVVWHTTFRGSSFETMSASFGEEIASGFKKVSTVWAVDATYKDVSGTATLTGSETKAVTEILSRAGKLLSQIKKETLETVSTSAINAPLKVFINQNVRAGTAPSGKQLVDGFKKYITVTAEKDAATKKTEKGKADTFARRDSIIAFLNTDQAIKLFDFYNVIVEAKIYLIRKLDKASALSTLLSTSNGFEVTGQEGFVAIDHTGANAVKLVDRLQFSKANFSPDVKKGWLR